MTLEQDFERVLIQLALCGYGATQAWNASGGHSGEPDDKVIVQLRSINEAPTVRYVRKWSLCRSDGQRQEVLSAAKDELAATRVRPEEARNGASISMDQVVIEDGEGLTPEEAGARFGYFPARVRRLRLKHGRDSESGLALEDRVLALTERREQAVTMRARGLSLRQIAMHLGVSAEMVRRDLAA